MGICERAWRREATTLKSQSLQHNPNEHNPTQSRKMGFFPHQDPRHKEPLALLWETWLPYSSPSLLEKPCSALSTPVKKQYADPHWVNSLRKQENLPEDLGKNAQALARQPRGIQLKNIEVLDLSAILYFFVLEATPFCHAHKGFHISSREQLCFERAMNHIHQSSSEK